MPTQRRKNIRLPPQEYLGQKAYFITICCEDRFPFFADANCATRLLETLREIGSKQYFTAYAYCAMPDHFHALVRGTEPQSNLLEFVRVFKLSTSFHEKARSGRRLWQRYFYDHILRPNDPGEGVAWYIWMNPVRKKLCADPRDYAHSGSFEVDWKSLYRPVEEWTPPWKM